MLNSTVLDVAIGLIFTFLAFSLAVSAIVEAIASVFKWRSATLLQGMKDLFNDHDLKGWREPLQPRAGKSARGRDMSRRKLSLTLQNLQLG